MQIAIIDEELPFPATSGKRLRTMNLLSRLAKRHRLTYICHRNDDSQEAREAPRYFADLGIETVVVDRQVARTSSASGTIRFYGGLASNLLSSVPYSVQSHTSSKLRQAIKQIAQRQSVDVWHCEWTPYAAALQGLGVGPVVVMAHNIESLIWRRYYENESNPLKRWYIGEQWRKFCRFEASVFAEANQVVTVSDQDAELASREFDARCVAVVDNGVDIDFFQPQPASCKPDRIIFLGSLDWRPNLDGVRMLLDTVFPSVLTKLPGAELWLVGRKPPGWLQQRAAATPNVQLHADVPDVRPYMAQCGVMAVPLRIGGGSRLKILEAAAFGVPVVSTRIGAEGLHLTPGEHFFQAENIEGMAELLVDCIENRRQALSMADRARRVIIERYNWDCLADRLEEVWLKSCNLLPC